VDTKRNNNKDTFSNTHS